MYVIIVYDTEHDNCVKLHKQLKKYLFWNQNSVFEGTVTVAQYAKIKHILEETRAEKFLCRDEQGSAKGNISNIL